MKKKNLEYLNVLFINQQSSLEGRNNKRLNDSSFFYGKRGAFRHANFHKNIKQLVVAVKVYDKLNEGVNRVLFAGSQKSLKKVSKSLVEGRNHSFSFGKWLGGSLTNTRSETAFSLGILFGHRGNGVIISELASTKTPVIAVGDYINLNSTKQSHKQVYQVYANEQSFKGLWFFLYLFLNKLKCVNKTCSKKTKNFLKTVRGLESFWATS